MLWAVYKAGADGYWGDFALPAVELFNRLSEVERRFAELAKRRGWKTHIVDEPGFFKGGRIVKVAHGKSAVPKLVLECIDTDEFLR